MEKIITMYQDRVTKGAVRYTEMVDEDGPSITQAYFRKNFLRAQGYSEPWPGRIHLTLTLPTPPVPAVPAGAGGKEIDT